MDNPVIVIIIAFGILFLILAIIIILNKIYDDKENNYINQYTESYKYKTPKPKEHNKKYKIKQRYISKCEIEYYSAIKSIIKGKYVIFPQIPLSQIVEKTNGDKYINELFRTIDFCIFNYEMKPLVCIEINDNSHYQKERYIRDKKVKDILNEANLPLITLWTEYGIKPDYIEKRLQEHLNF